MFTAAHGQRVKMPFRTIRTIHQQKAKAALYVVICRSRWHGGRGERKNGIYYYLHAKAKKKTKHFILVTNSRYRNSDDFFLLFFTISYTSTIHNKKRSPGLFNNCNTLTVHCHQGIQHDRRQICFYYNLCFGLMLLLCYWQIHISFFLILPCLYVLPEGGVTLIMSHCGFKPQCKTMHFQSKLLLNYVGFFFTFPFFPNCMSTFQTSINIVYGVALLILLIP